ncbi:PASTA domain-containing protein [Microbacterium sp. W4I20]|uniref:PASTA domain-containing protein n=1 Tax=Microbacterium sp. W4I20 TaxID=3042262 RepID=UPI00277FC7C0|nr:PASTA domain-containing protein [Microbacterium sp. W4I20]MDQ0725196.1 hypothetical protein [Microbacterium sp. W4I20]
MDAGERDVSGAGGGSAAANAGAAETADAGTPERRTAPRRRLIVIAGALAALALVVGGTAGGWHLANRTLIASASTGEESSEPAPVVDRVDSIVMPEVRGMSRADAEQVIADAGLVATVSFTDTPSALPEGIVVVQEPLSGAADPTTIVLGISVPAVMPDLIGQERDTALDTLSDLAVAGEVVFAYDPDADSGHVISLAPAPGTALGGTATVTVAARGAELDLLEVSADRDRCSTRSGLLLAGVEHSQAMTCDVARGGSVAWLLEGRADRITAALGLTDDSSPQASAHVRVFADGVAILDREVRFGAAVPLDARISGVLQLRIEVTGTGDASFAIAQPVLVGVDVAIAELAR